MLPALGFYPEPGTRSFGWFFFIFYLRPLMSSVRILFRQIYDKLTGEERRNAMSFKNMRMMLMVGFLVVGGFVLSGCPKKADKPADAPPATTEQQPAAPAGEAAPAAPAGEAATAESLCGKLVTESQAADPAADAAKIKGDCEAAVNAAPDKQAFIDGIMNACNDKAGAEFKTCYDTTAAAPAAPAQ